MAAMRKTTPNKAVIGRKSFLIGLFVTECQVVIDYDHDYDNDKDNEVTGRIHNRKNYIECFNMEHFYAKGLDIWDRIVKTD